MPNRSDRAARLRARPWQANDRRDRGSLRAHRAPALLDSSGGGRWRGTASQDRPTMGGLADPRRRRAVGTRRPTKPCCHRSGGRASGSPGNKVDLRPPRPLSDCRMRSRPGPPLSRMQIRRPVPIRASASVMPAAPAPTMQRSNGGARPVAGAQRRRSSAISASLAAHAAHIPIMVASTYADPKLA